MNYRFNRRDPMVLATGRRSAFSPILLHAIAAVDQRILAELDSTGGDPQQCGYCGSKFGEGDAYAIWWARPVCQPCYFKYTEDSDGYDSEKPCPIDLPDRSLGGAGLLEP